MTALRRYRNFLLTLVAGTVAFAFFFNTWANPWRVTPSPWTSEKLEDYRAIENDWNRTSKAGLIRSGSWDAAIFGSSRVDIALNPEHPLFEDHRCVNLGLNAANIVENHAMFRYFVEHQDARLVIFALDAGDLSTEPRNKSIADLPLSPLAEGDTLERELRYRVGISTLESSFNTTRRELTDTLPEHTPEGFRREPPFPKNQRALIGGLYTATKIRLARDRAKLDGISPEKLALLKDIIDTCRQRNIRLIFLITPNHALFQLAFPALDNPDPYFLRDRQTIVATADGFEVWDFLDAHPINLEPLPPADQPSAHMTHWTDTFHVTPEIGDLMLDRIAGADGDYGVQLSNPAQLESRIEAIKSGLSDYASKHSGDLEFLRESFKRFNGVALSEAP
ncbi:MAG: hypothetical protein AAGB14_13635 [Verrucomicrobiota bacterium]